MKTSNFTLLILLFFQVFRLTAQEKDILIGGEQLKYRIHLGFINAAEANIRSSSNLGSIRQIPTRKIEIEGKTLGIFNVFSPLLDVWVSHIDPSTLLPVKAEMNKREGRYRKQEVVDFYHDKGIAQISSPQNSPKDKNLAISNSMLDLISGYYFLRKKNLQDLEIGQKMSAKILVDGQVYEIWCVVKGFEKVESKFGTKNCIRTSLVLPKNNLFQDKDAIRLWISQDNYQIPFKMEVNLKIGFLSIDLEDYKIAGKTIYTALP
ncbi:DUF3108 domain-containing protein [Aquirufa rosea]|uniref:DUF3108 domain-containing protein n=1 Tax=Aquirufa rosea TaxID=2509241 RepID=UPI0013E92785|nr:DUF3108 domain-containing protein [Aquirufa rosea]